jgi:cysteine-rich repeat protein
MRGTRCAVVVATAAALLVTLAPAVGRAANATSPGAVTTPYPTIENLSVEWSITGDDNANGVVTVRFREAGTPTWRTGMPLRRVVAGSSQGFSWGHKHSGSLFDLKPATTYEIELTLTDPDGGSATQNVTATTRPVPAAPANAVVRSVTPATFAAAAGNAQPGDLLLLGAGSYAGFTFGRSGTASQPIVIRGESAAAVTITGDLRLDGLAFVYLEQLTVNGTIKLHSSEGIAITRCVVNTADDGIVAQLDGLKNGYIADNVVVGSTGWSNSTVGADGDNLGEGIQITGPGTVICHNSVKGFRDAISLMEDGEAVNQVSIDIYNNDIEVGADDAIEADFSMGNCRVLRNRITNSFVGISSQPGLGGPLYLIRNVMYNVVYSPFKLHRGSYGDVALHNTVVKCGDALGIYAGAVISRALFRNNLFLGGAGGGTYGGYGNGTGKVIQVADADAACDFDYDGLGAIGLSAFGGRLGAASFSGLAQLQSSTTEQHAVQLDLGVFAATVEFPASGPFPERAAADLRLAAAGAAVDRGVAIPNVNDGFGGSAPDLGAYEAGAPVPVYGPRPVGATPVCGNGVREGDEDCDDGNATDGDGCSSSCRIEAVAECASAADCDDGDPCTSDACAGGACTHAALSGCCTSAAQCDDGTACTTDTCVNNRCAQAPVPACCAAAADCVDTNPCTDERCEVATGTCQFTVRAGCCAVDTDCDDGDPCTVDRCANAACTHTPIASCGGGATPDGGAPAPGGAHEAASLHGGLSCAVAAAPPAPGLGLGVALGAALALLGWRRRGRRRAGSAR